jgi:hypothetical protein
LLAFPDRLVFVGMLLPLSSMLPDCLCCYLFSFKKNPVHLNKFPGHELQ